MLIQKIAMLLAVAYSNKFFLFLQVSFWGGKRIFFLFP